MRSEFLPERPNLRGATSATRFEQKIEYEPNSGCWLWAGAADGRGYGFFYNERRTTKAHRQSWLLFRGEIPRGLCVLHRCDTPACVNPGHLFLGTHADNSLDCALKGRLAKARGEDNARAILSESDVRAILANHQTDSLVATQFGVTDATIAAVRQGRTWRHLSNAPRRKLPHWRYTSEQILSAHRAYLAGANLKDAATSNGMTLKALSSIKTGKTWKSLGLDWSRPPEVAA